MAHYTPPYPIILVTVYYYRVSLYYKRGIVKGELPLRNNPGEKSLHTTPCGMFYRILLPVVVMYHLYYQMFIHLLYHLALLEEYRTCYSGGLWSGLANYTLPYSNLQSHPYNPYNVVPFYACNEAQHQLYQQCQLSLW